MQKVKANTANSTAIQHPKTAMWQSSEFHFLWSREYRRDGELCGAVVSVETVKRLRKKCDRDDLMAAISMCVAAAPVSPSPRGVAPCAPHAYISARLVGVGLLQGCTTCIDVCLAPFAAFVDGWPCDTP